MLNTPCIMPHCECSACRWKDCRWKYPVDGFRGQIEKAFLVLLPGFPPGIHPKTNFELQLHSPTDKWRLAPNEASGFAIFDQCSIGRHCVMQKNTDTLNSCTPRDLEVLPRSTKHVWPQLCRRGSSLPSARNRVTS